MCVCVCVCVCGWVSKCVCVHVHVCVCVCVGGWVSKCVCVHACACVCVCVCKANSSVGDRRWVWKRTGHLYSFHYRTERPVQHMLELLALPTHTHSTTPTDTQR